MSTTCYEGTSLSEKIIEPCNGCYTSSVCVVHPPAIPYLNLPANSKVSDIITNLILANVAKDEIIVGLNEAIADLTERVTNLENI